MKCSRHLAWIGLMAGWGGLALAEVPGAGGLDRRIESAFVESAVFQTHLRSEAIRAVSADGVVTLTGRVGNPCGKSLAQEYFGAFPGVLGIHNRIEVTLEGGERADAWVRSKVQCLLALHRRGGEPELQVDFRDGVISLSGLVTGEARLATALAYAADVDGVLRVTHEMRVAPATPEVVRGPVREEDSPSITAEVRVALKMHRSTSGLTPWVQTVQGVVTVSGFARSSDEIEHVSRIASDIRGVKNLVNRMVIATAEGPVLRPTPVRGLRVVIQ